MNPRYMPREIGDATADLDPPFNPNVPSSQYLGNNYIHYIPRHPQYILPPLSYTNNDAITLGQPMADITGYVWKSVAEFVIGSRDINSDAVWNAYLREMDNMGLQQWIRIAQTTYNRQK